MNKPVPKKDALRLVFITLRRGKIEPVVVAAKPLDNYPKEDRIAPELTGGFRRALESEPIKDRVRQ